MDKISVTLYDLVGYAIPGFIGLMSLVITASLFFENVVFVNILHKLNIVWQIGLAYTFGHVIQSAASIVWKNDYASHIVKIGFENSVIERFAERVARKSNAECNSLTHYDIAAAENDHGCAMCVHKINIFRAFQGLYKGIAAVCVLLSIELIALIWHAPSYELVYSGQSFIFVRVHFVIAFVVVAMLCCVSVKRHDDFVRSRLRVVVSTYSDL